MARREFTQLPHKYGDGKYGFAQGQTRDGVEEFVQPVELRKKNPDTGLLEPSEELAQLKAELESVKEELQAIRASQTDGTQKVQVSGSLPAGSNTIGTVGVTGARSVATKATIATIANAVSVAAGGDTGNIDLGVTNEDEIWLAISIDKQPWDMYTGTVYFTAATLGSPTTNYPARSSSTLIATNATPAISLVLGVDVTTIGTVDSMQKAKDVQIPPVAGMQVRIKNKHATDVATVTIRAIRVWRGL